mgnify:CR=1 FL=1
MTNQPTRADWWREVTDPDEVIPKGCPVRTEYGEKAIENRTTRRWTRPAFCENSRLFIDSRWTPAYKVGDVITECTPDNLPPEGVGLVNGEGDLCQIRQGRALWAVPAVSYGWEILNDATPLTVIYVPKVGDDE